MVYRGLSMYEARASWLGLLLLWGCSGGAREQAGDALVVTVTDSLGVQIIRNVGDDRLLSAELTSQIGVTSGDPTLQFDRIRGLALDGRGGFWITDSDPRVRHYSGDGVFLGSVGGRGDGPGEAPEGYGPVWYGGGSVFVLRYPSVLQSFSDDGTYEGARSALRGRSESFITPLRALEVGWLFKVSSLPATSLIGRERWSIARGSSAGDDLTDLVALAGEPLREPSPGRWHNGAFFDGFPSLGTDARGRIFYTDSLGYSVEIRSSTGEVVRIVTRATERRALPSGLRSQVEAGVHRAFEELGGRGSDGERASWVVAALPSGSPAWLPALDLILVSSDGSFWVRRADHHPNPALRSVAAVSGFVPSAWLNEWRADSVFDLFSTMGEYRGTTTLPTAFVPMVVDDLHVFGVLTDSLDVEYVAGFSVVLSQ